MSKRILSLMLCFVMVFSMSITANVSAATHESTQLKVIPDKTTATPGDVINYTLVMGPVSDLGSIQFDVVIPEGLTYLPNSGRISDGLKNTLGFDSLDWTESSKTVNGTASAADYESDADTVLGTFQCKVNNGFTGTTSVDLTNLEFFSCVTFEDHTSRFSVVPGVVTIEAPAGNLPVYESTEVKVIPNKTTANPGDTITYTITLGPVSDLGSMQMDVVIPDGLTYVVGSGKLSEGLQDILGFDALDWTEVSKMINGYASRADYRCDTDTVLATLQCTVDEGYTGTATVGLTNLEFYSCQGEWPDLTARYSVSSVDVTIEEDTDEPTLEDHQLAITADKTIAKPGDIIDYTITMGPVSDLGSMQMEVVIPEGLTYVANSGKITDGLKEDMGFDSLEWTEESKIVNGGASAADYNSNKDTVLATFQCSVNEGFSGTATVDLTYLEFYSCRTWTDHTSRYSVVPSVITVEDTGSSDPVYESTELRVTPDKTTANPGDIITYTVTMGPVSNLGSMQMDVVIPEGLTYVVGSGKLADGLMEKLGFDSLDWTEISKMINGYASQADYRCDTDTTLATFQCIVDADYTGTATVGLTNLEFYSCQGEWPELTSRFGVVTTDVEVEAVAPPQTTTHTSYQIDAEAKPNPITGNKIFNEDENVFVDFTISSEEIDSLGAFDFSFTYDSTKLTLLDIESNIGSESGILTTDISQKQVKFTVDGEKPAFDITNGKLVATAVFKVNNGASGQTEIGFSDAKIIPLGYEANTCAPTTNSESVTISNIVITFVPGEYATFTNGETSVSGKVNYNVPGFVETSFTIPSGLLQAKDTYRMKADTMAEPLWKVEGEEVYYTSEQLMTTAFTQNVTLVAQVVKTYKVEIVAGENGSISGTTSLVVDAGTVITATQLSGMVTAVANPGYVFGSFDYAGTPINADTTIKAKFEAGRYTISTTFVPASIALLTGVEDGDEIVHGIDVVFQMTPVHSNITDFGYIIKGVKNPLAKDPSGNYTIPGEAIIDDIAIYVITADIYPVSFVSSGNGTVDIDATYMINKGEKLTPEILDDVETKISAASGYRFDNYSIDGRKVTEADLLARAIYGALKIDVNFTHRDYILTDVNGNPVTVTHGNNFTFTPVVDGAIVTDVIGIYEGGASVDIAKNADGSYTISGNDIVDNITLTAEKTSGSISFIFNTRYKALKARRGEADVKIAVIETAKLTDKKYVLAESGATFYWSEKYGAYVYIVAGATANDGVTANMIAAQLETVDGAAPDVDYSGDMNHDGYITVTDAMIITDILHQKRVIETSIIQKLMADIDGSGYVSTKDVDIVRAKAN